jgi:hypothetical protein
MDTSQFNLIVLEASPKKTSKKHDVGAGRDQASGGRVKTDP